MDKPITIIYEEFKANLADLINGSSLPACIIEPILESYLMDIRMIARKQYELDKKQYEDSIDK